jgi:hypothetical protein
VGSLPPLAPDNPKPPNRGASRGCGRVNEKKG